MKRHHPPSPCKQEQLEGTPAEQKVTRLLLEAVERATGLPQGELRTKVSPFALMARGWERRERANGAREVSEVSEREL